MQYRFGNIENDEMTLNEYGTIAYNEWIKLTERFSYLELDVFQIMPNHMRSIIALNPVRAGFTPAQIHTQNNDEIFGQSPNGQPQ
jgi:REP element-mobilizing transposase RayT